MCVAPGLIDTPEKESDVTAALEKFLELDKESIQKKLALKGTLYQGGQDQGGEAAGG